METRSGDILFRRHAGFSSITTKILLGADRGLSPSWQFFVRTKKNWGVKCECRIRKVLANGTIFIKPMAPLRIPLKLQNAPLSFSRAYFYALGQGASYGDERTHPTQLWLTGKITIYSLSYRVITC
ncbi:hypothetical protein BZG06_15375 [Salinivibrio kushneri]|nr:hypothetical protein BZG06_15375 [Salinivibrio kushneri]